MKKSILIVSALVFFGLVGHAAAQGFVPLAPIPGLTDPGTADSVARSQNLAVFFNNLYKYLIGLAAVLAIIMIIWDGLRIATNQDNVSIITDSKGRIYNAIFGLVLVLSPVLVFSIINPSILNLSIGLKPLDTASAPVQNTGQQRSPAQVAADAAQQGRLVPTTSSNEMTTTYMACTPDTCNSVKNTCLANNSIQNTGDATVVCLTSDGSVDPNGRSDSWWQSYSCKPGRNLAVQCIQFTGTTARP